MTSSAVRALALEYKSLLDEPVEGFRVKLLNDDNLFEWSVSPVTHRLCTPHSDFSFLFIFISRLAYSVLPKHFIKADILR